MTFPYLTLDPRGWRLSMGLRPLEPSSWLEVDERRDEELMVKSQLLEHHFAAVVATLLEGEEASAELCREIVQWLALYAPSVRRDVDVDVDVQDHPIVAGARLVQEDLCVLVRRDAWRLAAACVCFPSRWDLSSKLGATLDEIHSPVPGYQENLSGPTNGVFDRLSADKPYWRLNWTVMDDPALHQPAPARSLSLENVEHWFFRVERQTIRKLPQTGAIAFTIRTYVASLHELRSVPAFTENLYRGISGAPVSTQRYKGWVGVAELLRDTMS